ncbi:MAG: F0F1 ATP synthase subunit delta [Lacisediminihabitans sp.]
MGSATREALGAARAALAALGGSCPGSASLQLAEDLFAARRVIGDSSQLRALLFDPSSETVDKKAAITAVFGTALQATSQDLLSAIVGTHWSSEDDLLAGIDELGLRAAAESAPAAIDVGSELFAFATAVSSDNELELAVGSKLGGGAKVVLVERLLAKKVSPQTLAIVRHLVQAPRGRRIGAALQHAASVVADQAGLSVATVTSAAPIADEQLARLRKGLAASYGRDLRINLVLDPALIGGLRVQIGDDIIDGSVASRLGELRLQFAGRA